MDLFSLYREYYKSQQAALNEKVQIALYEYIQQTAGRVLRLKKEDKEDVAGESFLVLLPVLERKEIRTAQKGTFYKYINSRIKSRAAGFIKEEMKLQRMVDELNREWVGRGLVSKKEPGGW